MEGRVLDSEPVDGLDAYQAAGGGKAQAVAAEVGPVELIQLLTDSGLRGRGGAGFPTGTKWQTIAENTSTEVPTTVVVNAAEGEPGSFKDRAILRRNPYRVLEGLVVAGRALAADRLIVALKSAFDAEQQRVTVAIDEAKEAGWFDGVDVFVAEGPGEYLFGEETALLEVIDGRGPFPRIAPPWRLGVDQLGTETQEPAGSQMATSSQETAVPPTLVNNVETLANVPGIVVNGADWFREVGTEDSAGTVVCTVSGHTVRDDVGEVAMGTPLSEVIGEIGGGVHPGRRVLGVLSGVAHPMLPGDRLDTPVSYEGMEAAGAGLGAAGFLVFDDETDMVSVANGVARFLAIESCGQCTPCKQDGLDLATLTDELRRSDATDDALTLVAERLERVTEGARCFLAHQQQRVLASIFELFPHEVLGHADGDVDPAEPMLIAPIADIRSGEAVLDEDHWRKQPDWSFGDEWDGKSPADLIDQAKNEP